MTSPQRTDWARRHPLVVDGIICLLAGLLLAPSSVTAVAEGDSMIGWKVAMWTALTMLHVVPLTRRPAAGPTFGMATLAMALLAIAPHVTYESAPAPAILLPSSLLYFLALYEVCASDDRRVVAAAVGSAVVGACVVTVRLSSDTPGEFGVLAAGAAWLVLAGLSLGGITASWSLGRLRRTREQYQHWLARQSALDERARIAREMHDVVSHSLSVMIAQAEGGRFASTEPQSVEVFRTIGATGRSALEDMRGLLGLLRDDRTGRCPAPTWRHIEALATQTTDAGLPTTYAESGVPRHLSAGASLAAYRIAQESLTNAMKHAGPAARVTVELSWHTDALHLRISTTGRRTAHAVEGGGTRSMRERAEAYGGTAHSSPAANGWQVEAELPVGPPA